MKGSLYVLLLCGFVSASVPAADPGNFGGFGGRRFALKSVDGAETSYEKEILLQFAADGTVSGNICNSFRGPGRLENGILVVDPIAATRMLCTAGGLSALENRVFAMLRRGAALIETADGIDMRRDDVILSFVEVVPDKPDVFAGEPEVAAAGMEAGLVGRRFILARVNGEAFMPAEGQQPFINFADDMRMSGSACNAFAGRGELRDGKLYLRNAAATMMLCTDPALDRFERRFHQLLQGGADIELNGATLILRGGGTELTYESE